MKTERQRPGLFRMRAKDYDALKRVTDKVGGIGAGSMFEYGDESSTPWCAYGCAWEAGLLQKYTRDSLYRASEARALPFSYAQSDYAVFRAKKRGEARITFTRWARALGLRRGLK